VTASGPVAISVTPTSASVQVGQTQPCSATVTNATDTTVLWTTTGGALSSTSTPSGTSVTWTAPQVAGTYTVTAKSQQDPTKTATFAIRVSPAVCTPVN
jgi:uncharacterized protein YjdB